MEKDEKFEKEPCPQGTDQTAWARFQNERQKEWEARKRTQEHEGYLVWGVALAIVICLVLLFVYRDPPEPINEDVRSLATQLHVTLPTHEEKHWTIDKDIRSDARSALFAAIGAILGYVVGGRKKKGE